MADLLTLEGGWTTTSEAEQGFRDAAAGLGRRIALACTHFDTAEGAVVVTGQTGRLEPIEGGRAFVFPGSDRLAGQVSVGDVLAHTAIDRLVCLGGTPVAADKTLDTQDFVRPTFAGGSLVLHVRPGIDGVFVPFEQPNPTPCCADHG